MTVYNFKIEFLANNKFQIVRTEKIDTPDQELEKIRKIYHERSSMSSHPFPTPLAAIVYLQGRITALKEHVASTWSSANFLFGRSTDYQKTHLDLLQKYSAELAAEHQQLCRFQAIKHLLEKGAPMPADVLFEVVKAGQTELVQLLLKRGVDLTITDTNGQTPLALAKSANQHPEIIVLLEDALKMIQPPLPPPAPPAAPFHEMTEQEKSRLAELEKLAQEQEEEIALLEKKLLAAQKQRTQLDAVNKKMKGE